MLVMLVIYTAPGVKRKECNKCWTFSNIHQFWKPQGRGLRGIGGMLKQVHLINQGLILQCKKNSSLGFVSMRREDAHGPDYH